MRHHGENSTLSNAEHHRVIEITVEQAAGRVPIIAGCGSNDTQNALLHMNFSRKCGASAALLVAPYYNRPSQAGLLAHFSYLAEHNDLPIVLYNARAHGDRHQAGNGDRTGPSLSQQDHRHQGCQW
jgi:4-hydroxy-tetrahydrodipicolinate synthase